MNVTIFSDASICPETKAAGWAGWIKSDRGVLSVHGELKTLLIDTTIAEAMAAMNAICYGISSGNICEGDVIVLATDNNSVMDVIEGKIRRKFRLKDARRRGWSMKEQRLHVDTSNHHIRRISEIYQKKVLARGINLKWNHVKGHRGTVDRRSAVNHGCDRRAKTAMRMARKKLRTKSD